MSQGPEWEERPVIAHERTVDVLAALSFAFGAAGWLICVGPFGAFAIVLALVSFVLNWRTSTAFSKGLAVVGLLLGCAEALYAAGVIQQAVQGR